MAMAMTPMLSPNTTPFSSSSSTTTTTKHVIINHKFPSLTNKSPNSKRESLLIPRVASSIPYYQPNNVDSLEQEFSGHGVSFQELGDSCVAKLALDNGSTAVLMLPSGLITSYKAAMWHHGTDEVLHSFVSEDSNGTAVKGGVSIALEFGAKNGVPWSPSNWVLHKIRGNSRDSIEVELMSHDSRDMVEVKHIVSLRKNELSSDIVITNSSSIPVQLTGCVLSHLRVSSPEATFVIGLEGSDFFIRPPFTSNCGVIPPEFGQKRGSRFNQIIYQISFWVGEKKTESPKEEILEGEEDNNYKNLSEEMSLIYTSAPRNMTLIDRGRRNSVIVGRKGFEELYMFSPGSSYEIYGKYAFVCVGQSAMLRPLIVGPQQVLHLGQDLYNPNL